MAAIVFPSLACLYPDLSGLMHRGLNRSFLWSWALPDQLFFSSDLLVILLFLYGTSCFYHATNPHLCSVCVGPTCMSSRPALLRFNVLLHGMSKCCLLACATCLQAWYKYWFVRHSRCQVPVCCFCYLAYTFKDHAKARKFCSLSNIRGWSEQFWIT